MTPEQLTECGYALFLWNGGLIQEYWKPLRSDDFNCRLGIRFNEFRDIKTPNVWLALPHYMHLCRNIKTVEQLEQLYRLLRED